MDLRWNNSISYGSTTTYKDLSKLVCSYLQIDECRNLSEIPMIINSDENIWND